MTTVDFETIWPTINDKFVKFDDGSLVNERLESVRLKALALSEKRAKAGAKGGQAIASHLLKQKQGKGSMKSEDRSKKNKYKKEVAEVVEDYRARHPRSRPGDKELGKIRDRLAEGFTVEDLKLAIEGCHISPFHSGQNDSGAKYQTLELIVRDASKVSRFIELAGEHGGPVLSEKTRRSLSAVSSWLSKEESNGVAH